MEYSKGEIVQAHSNSLGGWIEGCTVEEFFTEDGVHNNYAVTRGMVLVVFPDFSTKKYVKPENYADVLKKSKVLDWTVGESVYAWSGSENRWIPSCVVRGAFTKTESFEGYAVTPGMVVVEYPSGAKKFVPRDQHAQVLKKTAQAQREEAEAERVLREAEEAERVRRDAEAAEKAAFEEAERARLAAVQAARHADEERLRKEAEEAERIRLARQVSAPPAAQYASWDSASTLAQKPPMTGPPLSTNARPAAKVSFGMQGRPPSESDDLRYAQQVQAEEGSPPTYTADVRLAKQLQEEGDGEYAALEQRRETEAAEEAERRRKEAEEVKHLAAQIGTDLLLAPQSGNEAARAQTSPLRGPPAGTKPAPVEVAKAPPTTTGAPVRERPSPSELDILWTNGFEAYREKFTAEKIDTLEDAKKMSDEDLAELGVESNDRYRLLTFLTTRC